MNRPRPYDCDPAKAATNLRKHGLSFDDGFKVLQAEPRKCLDVIDGREDYGEERWIRIGPHPEIPSLILHVSWTPRGEHPRLISVRKASRAERHRHAHRYEKSR